MGHMRVPRNGGRGLGDISLSGRTNECMKLRDECTKPRVTYQPHGTPRPVRVALIALFGNRAVVMEGSVQAMGENITVE